MQQLDKFLEEQEKADTQAALKESRKIANEQKKADRKKINDQLKDQQQELKQAHIDALQKVKDKFQSTTAGMPIKSQE